MAATHHKSLSASLLLSAALVWLLSVTVCSARVLPETPHEHTASSGHSEHAHHSHGLAHDHDGQQKDDGCGCEHFKDFPAKSVDTTAMSAPAANLLFVLLPINDLALRQEAPALRVQNTGPPEAKSFAERFLQRCLLSQAPPDVV